MLQKYKVEYTEKNLKYFYNGTSPQRLNSKYTLEKKKRTGMEPLELSPIKINMWVIFCFDTAF